MATVVGHDIIQLDAVSLAEDSGWCELDGGRVDELVAMILDGYWGATSLAGPSLVAQGGHKLISVEDGKFVIFKREAYRQGIDCGPGSCEKL